MFIAHCQIVKCYQELNVCFVFILNLDGQITCCKYYRCYLIFNFAFIFVYTTAKGNQRSGEEHKYVLYKIIKNIWRKPFCTYCTKKNKIKYIYSMATLLGKVQLRTVQLLVNKYPVSGSSVGSNVLFEESGPTSSSWKKGNSNTNNHSLQPRYAEEHLWTQNKFNLEAKGLQLQKSILGGQQRADTPVSKEHET